MKQRSWFVLAVALAWFLTMASEASAGIIVNHSPPSLDNAYFSDVNFPQILADNFTLTTAAAPDTLTFWGVYGGNVPPGADAFTLAFYADAGGAPGALITSLGITATRTLYATSGFDNYQYDTTFAPVALGPGTYWMTVNNTTASGDWAWNFFLIADNYLAFSTEASSTPSSWNTFSGGSDLAFVLSESQAVPEPASLALAALGALSLAGYGWRRKKPAA